MSELPESIESAIAQATEATNAAIADGYSLVQVELLIPELKQMLVAEQFLTGFTQYGSKLKVFFPDAGAAALARRDWGDVPFKITDIGTGKVPPEVQIQPEDEAIIFINPSSVEVNQVEKLCEVAQDRLVIMLNPRLEDAAIVGIGYTARQLRDRFINNIQSCYHLRPLEGVTVFRCYPGLWQVWRETSDDYKLIVELPKKPTGEEIDQLLFGTPKSDPADPKKPGLFVSMQRFLRTFTR